MAPTRAETEMCRGHPGGRGDDRQGLEYHRAEPDRVVP